jgi:translation initiation factor IF-2
MVRGAKARLVRDGVVVYDGRIESLRRFKDDVRTVAAGYECGIGLENYNDVKEGDVIEAYEMVEIPR